MWGRSAGSFVGQLATAKRRPTWEDLRAENEDLRKFIDEVYALLKKEGIHIQLDLEMDENGKVCPVRRQTCFVTFNYYKKQARPLRKGPFSRHYRNKYQGNAQISTIPECLVKQLP